MAKKSPDDYPSSPDQANFYQDLVETSRDLFWQCNALGHYTYLNPAWESVFGYAVTEMLGRPITDFQPAESRSTDGGCFAAVAKHGKVKDYETILLAKSGQRIHLAFNAVAIRDAAGNLAGARGTAFDIGERKLTEQKLKESEARYRFISENAHDIIWCLSLATGKFTYLSPSVERLRGFTPEEGAQQTIADVLTPESLVKANALLQQSIADRKPGDTSAFRFISQLDQNRKNGSVVPTEVAVSLVFSPDGQPRELIGVTRDITERKLAEQKLRESEEKYRNIVDRAPIAIFQKESSGPYLYVNPSMLRQFECTSLEEFLSSYGSPQQRWAKDEDYLAFKAELLRNRSVYDYKMETKPIHGRPKFLSLTAFLGDDDLVINGFALDITEHVIAEEAVAAERERLRVTLRSIGDGVITTDTEGKVVIINQVAEALTGWRQCDAQGRPLADVFNIIDEASRVSRESPVDRVLGSGQIVELASHTVLVGRDGVEHMIADSGAPIKDKGDKTIGVVLVFRDMTEKLKIQEALQRADKLDALGVLAGGIAHDFNNLLAGLFGYIDLARRTTVIDADAAEYLEGAMSAFSRARDLTRQLLTFSRGGAPVRETGQVGPILVESTKFALSGANITCDFQVAEDLHLCDFDRNQIAQVIDNLVINAKQAMPRGGQLVVSAENTFLRQGAHAGLPAACYIKISIADSGTGIPANAIKKIFDPFFTTKTEGNGLGLATSYSIMQKHNGAIEVESEIGKGSTFALFLPCSNTAVSLASQSKVVHHGRGTVLVMDDQDVVRGVIRSALSEMGYSVIPTRTGDEALAVLADAHRQGTSMACAILDLTVPAGMGGVETLAHLRKTHPDLMVFATSGYSDSPVMSRPREFGFTDSIRKPFLHKELAAMLNRHLGQAV
jgi:PAS domain S-box-containing protein